MAENNREPLRTYRAQDDVIRAADATLKGMEASRRVVVTIAPGTSRSAAIVAFLRALARKA